jgi:hypothetical protein
MVTNVRVELQYKGDIQWEIKFDLNNEERVFSHIYELELVSFYHTLAKILNTKYGCDFVYLDSEINRTKDVPSRLRDNGYHHFTWTYEYDELCHKYRYNKGDYISTTTYGRICLDDMKAIVKGVGDYILNNDVHQLSYENLKVDWLRSWDRGSRVTPPDAYRHLFEADKDFTEERLEQGRIKERLDRWSRCAEGTLVLSSSPMEELRVILNGKVTKFFKREGNECASYTYPPLAELRKDPKFIDAVTDCLIESCQYNAEAVTQWSIGDCDFPPFPLSVIYHCEYENYDYDDYIR